MSTTTSIKKKHDQTILHYLFEHPGCIRKQILADLRLRRNTLTESCARMLRQGKIMEINRGKRRNIHLKVRPDAFLAFGLHHTSSGVFIVFMDSDKQIRAKEFLPLDKELTGSARCRHIAKALAKKQAGMSRKFNPLGIGFSDIGRVNEKSGRSILSAALKGWENVPIRAIFTKQSGLPLRLFHSSPPNCVAERIFGCASNWNEFLFLWADKRIGLGIQSAQGLLRASSGVEGELGHVVVEENGLACACGNRGCLETVASAEAICRSAADVSSGKTPTFEEITKAARNGQASALQAFEHSALAIGRILAGIINVVGISNIVVKGCLADSGEVFLAPLRNVLTRHCVDPLSSNLDVKTSTTDEFAGAAGAAWLVLEEAMAKPAPTR